MAVPVAGVLRRFGDFSDIAPSFTSVALQFVLVSLTG